MARYHVLVTYSTHADDEEEAVRLFFHASQAPAAMFCEVFRECDGGPTAEFSDAALAALAREGRT